MRRLPPLSSGLSVATGTPLAHAALCECRNCAYRASRSANPRPDSYTDALGAPRSVVHILILPPLRLPPSRCRRLRRRFRHQPHACRRRCCRCRSCRRRRCRSPRSWRRCHCRQPRCSMISCCCRISRHICTSPRAFGKLHDSRCCP